MYDMNLIVFSPYTSTIPLSFLRPFVNEEQVCVGLVCTTPCPGHVVTSSLRESQSHLFQTSYCGLHPSALKSAVFLTYLAHVLIWILALIP